MDIGLQITGLEQVQRALTELPAQIVALAYAKALDRAAGVVAAEVERRAPEGDEELLKDNVAVTVTVDTDLKGGSAMVGYTKTQNEDGYPADLIALWIEFGHRMVGHKPGKKLLKGPKTPEGKVLANPFMRQAAEASSDRAIEVFGDTLIEGLSDIGESA